MSKKLSRKDFLKNSAAVAAAASVGGASVLTSCASGGQKAAEGNARLYSEELVKKIPVFMDRAVEGKPIRAAQIGCGGRGTGASFNFLSAGDGLSVEVLVDVLPDKIEACRELLNKEKGQNISKDKCYLGFDAYKKAMEDPNIDVVLICVPSRFAPAIFAAAIESGKHVFLEKPCGVDAPGARSVMATAKRADSKGLSVVCGTQRRHGRHYAACFEQVAAGAIGEIRGGSCSWDTARTSYVNRKPGWTDAEYLIRNWLNYPFLGGDCIVDHHIHNIDVITWFLGEKNPVRARGYGAKVHPSLGAKYDFYAVEYIYDNDIRIFSSTRHIDGCTNNVSEYLVGTKGKTNCLDTIWDMDGNVIWKYEGSRKDEYDQEHVDWVNSIRQNKPLNEAHNMARSTMITIMGRNSAWTGIDTTWDDMMATDETLLPDITALGLVPYSDEHPVPGQATVKDATGQNWKV